MLIRLHDRLFNVNFVAGDLRFYLINPLLLDAPPLSCLQKSCRHQRQQRITKLADGQKSAAKMNEAQSASNVAE
jgi:hypothetical protein